MFLTVLSVLPLALLFFLRTDLSVFPLSPLLFLRTDLSAFPLSLTLFLRTDLSALPLHPAFFLFQNVPFADFLAHALPVKTVSSHFPTLVSSE